MRLAPLLALLSRLAPLMALAIPADAQQRRVYRAATRPSASPSSTRTAAPAPASQCGRAATSTAAPKCVPGERKFMDYAQAPTYGWLAPTSSWDPLGIHRFPLPMPFELPGYSPYSYY